MNNPLNQEKIAYSFPVNVIDNGHEHHEITLFPQGPVALLLATVAKHLPLMEQLARRTCLASNGYITTSQLSELPSFKLATPCSPTTHEEQNIYLYEQVVRVNAITQVSTDNLRDIPSGELPVLDNGLVWVHPTHKQAYVRRRI